MPKYDPLTRHLSERRQAVVAMTFPELEAVLGFPLPPSARRHRAWWSNNPQNNVMTQAWLAAGYQSRDVDLAAQRLLFERLNAVEATVPSGQSPAKRGRHPLFGLFAGQIWIDPTLDLTEPAMPEWAAMVDAKYGPGPDEVS